MHEISLVQNLFQQLIELAAANEATKIIRVTMEIGPLSGVVEDSFRFGFEILSAEYPLMQDAELVIEVPAVSYTCTSCGNILTTGRRPESCPKCTETLLVPAGGDDMILKQVELE
jgi:hydrogenase nickel incorporation protein HypA/HybF